MRILVVDDEQIVRETVAGVLRDMGHEVVLAESAEAAFELSKRSTFDALITDMQMPGESGLFLIEELVAREKCPKKVVLMTANTLPPRAKQKLCLLSKPFSLQDLERFLEETE